MSVLGRALRRTDLQFPLVLEFPGDAEHGRTEATFNDRKSVERTLDAAQVSAVGAGLAIYTLPDGGFVLAGRASADPWCDYVEETTPRRGWLQSVGRNWLGIRR